MSDHEPFLTEICQRPADDLPRLVYADWLEERGDPHGEFIRVQCELAHLSTHDPRRTDLESRELVRLRQHRKGWAGDVRRVVGSWTFARGFVDAITIDTERFLAQGEELLRLAPIQRVHLLNCREAHHFAGLAAPWVSRLKGISISVYNNPGIWASHHPESPLGWLLQSPRLQGLEELAMQGCGVTDWDAVTLATADLPELTSLDLRSNPLSTYGRERLCHGRARLRTLRLGNCVPAGSADPVTSLARDLRSLTQLETLELRAAGITVECLPALASSAPQLRSLILADNNLLLVRREPPALPSLPWLETLDLSHSGVGPDLLKLLLEAGWLQSVRTLDLSDNPLFAAGVGRLVEAGLPHLARLRLHGGRSGLQIGDNGLAALAQDRLPGLASLELRGAGITSEGVKRLARSPLLEKLFLLDLRDNLIDADAAKLLVQLGPWPRLACLNLSQCQITSRPRRDLIAKFGWRVVV